MDNKNQEVFVSDEQTFQVLDYVSETERDFSQPFSQTELDKWSPVQKLGIYVDRASYPPSGEVHIQDENLSIDLSYEPIPDDADSKYFLDHMPASKKDGWKLMNNLTIGNSSSGEQVDLTKILPEGYRIFFRPGRGMWGKQQVINDNDINIIQCEGDFAQLRTLVALSHEISHPNIDSSYDPATKARIVDIRENFTYFKSRYSEEDLNLIITDEQNAWEFAHKMLLPIIDSQAHQFLTEETFRAEEKRALDTYIKVVDQRLGRVPIEL